LIGYDTDVNTYKEGTLRLSLVDSEKNIVWKGRPPTVFFKMNLLFVDDMKYPKSLIQMTSSEIIDSLNRNTKLIINTKINIMKN
jgi:hypothetical protein